MTKTAELTGDYRALDDYIDSLNQKKENLIGILHHAQELYGYLPVELQMHIAQKLDIPASKVYGIVSFYSFFTMKPRGKHLACICMGTACFVRGATELQAELEKQLGIKTGEITSDQVFSLETLRCVGSCGLAPVLMVDGKVHGRLHEPEAITKVLKLYRPEG